jgi:hypothetical protein
MNIFLSALNSQIRVTDRPMTRQGIGIATGAKGTNLVLMRNSVIKYNTKDKNR